MVETWQPVKRFPDYEVSNLGHFREKATGKAVKVYKGWYVHLMRNGILYARSAAKLVAQVYVPNPDPKNKKRVERYNGKFTDIKAETCTGQTGRSGTVRTKITRLSRRKKAY